MSTAQTQKDVMDIFKVNRVIFDKLKAEGVSVVVPEMLSSALYADASHPLTEGYREMARRVAADGEFVSWGRRGRVSSKQ